MHHGRLSSQLAMSLTDGVETHHDQSRVRDEEKELENSARDKSNIEDEKAYLVTWDEHDPDKLVCYSAPSTA